jgi:glycolate dehydrogenase FAD-binding subunit
MLTCSPASVEECSAALATKHRIAFIGGGTQLELGNPPDAIDVEVRTDRMKRIVDYSASDMVLAAEAGVTLAEINAAAREHRQMLALDPPQPERATIGGLVATGAYGPRRARYGAIRDLIIGITIVRADGVVAHGGGKVVKNVAGFDLPKIACGSLGTLGMIADATFRLHPLPEMSATAVFRGLTPERVLSTTKRIRDAQLEPTSVVALRTASGTYDLGVRFEGFSKGVEQQIRRLGAEDSGENFWEGHDATRSGGPVRIRIAALPWRFAEVARIIEQLQPSRFAWYATLGIGFLECGGHAAALQAARSSVVEIGGSLVIESAPHDVRSAIDAWGPVGNSFRIMEELKLRFDPERRLNPGRFVGGL